MSTRVRTSLNVSVTSYSHNLSITEKGGPIFRPVAAKPRGRSTTENTSRQSSVAADHLGFPIAVASLSVPPITQSTSAPPAPIENSQLRSSNLTFNPILLGPPPVHYHNSAFEQQPNSNEGAGSGYSGHPRGLDVPGFPRLAIMNDSIVKVAPPRRKSGQKKMATIGEGELLSDGAEEAVRCETENNTRPRVSQNVEEVFTVGAEIQSTNTVAKRVHGAPTIVAGKPLGTKRKRRSSSDPRKPRKSRGPSHPPFNPNADPGEELDPTVVTMATLCSDTGQGRISSKAVQIQNNHITWKATNREKRARMKMLMENKKYGKKDGVEEAVSDAPVASAAPAETSVSGNAGAGPSNHSASGSVRASSAGPVPEDETGQGFDYSQSMSTSRFNVQVRIGPNGETIIDEESLFVDRADENETVNYTHVEESDTTKFVNSSTYGKKFRGSRWSGEETELFFDVSLLFYCWTFF